MQCCNFLGRDWNRTFFNIRVFSPITQSQKYFPQAVLQVQWAERMINVWEKSAWILLTPIFFNFRRSGTNSQLGLQKNSLNDCPETWQDKQQDPPLDQTQTELLTSALSNYVPKGSIHHPATSPDTMDVTCHKGQVPLQWTEPINTQTPCIIILYTICISIWFTEWISIPIKKQEFHMVKIRAGEDCFQGLSKGWWLYVGYWLQNWLRIASKV